eukprot:scaffold12616_cov29-Tisochrysis_lutea.AAC.1
MLIHQVLPDLEQVNHEGGQRAVGALPVHSRRKVKRTIRRRLTAMGLWCGTRENGALYRCASFTHQKDKSESNQACTAQLLEHNYGQNCGLCVCVCA